MVDAAPSETRVPATRRGRARAPKRAGDGPPLPAPPERSEARHCADRALGAAFRLLNGSTTIPLLRAGLGSWLGSPLGGWMLLLRVRGRKSRLVREIPLSYLVDEGAAWVMAGFGPRTQWYRNLLADPQVEVILPGRTRRCVADEVLDRDVRRRILPKLLRATGVPGYMSGCDPWRAPVDRVLEVTAWVPLIRLRPVGEPLVAGPDDPGGLGWVWRQAVAISLTVWVARIAARVVGRIGSRARRFAEGA
jgi:deazaflavin-dependent oxidoreductase (nitroreductase family)